MKSFNRFISISIVVAILIGVLASCESSVPADTANTQGDSAQSTVSAESSKETSATECRTFISDGMSEIPAENQKLIENPDSDSNNLHSQMTAEPGSLDDVQRNSIAMLNYLTVLTQEISSSKGSRLFLEQTYSSLINNTYPNAVDVWTQAELDELLDTLEAFRMVSVKRERLQLIYEHNKAQALRSAIPNPITILSNVSSRSFLQTAVSLIFMAVDSVSSYNAYNDQNDMQYLKDGWELDDEEASELSDMRRSSFSYMIDMVRDNSLPGDLALNENAVSDFVAWKNKSNVVSRISILEANEKTYAAMGSYWLTLSKSYYENGDYTKCLSAMDRFESMTSRIFRKDYEYAETLPYAILAAQELYSGAEYETLVKRYCETILSNTDATDWASHYFVALIYMDLYAATNNNQYLDESYRIALENVTYLVDEQKKLNATWLNPVQEATAGKKASKQEKEDIKQYNKLLNEERKTALPPINEPLYLNCDLLFSLAEKEDISTAEKAKIDAILHENGENIFLVAPLDNSFRYASGTSYPDVSSMETEFNGKTLTIPAYAVSTGAKIVVTIKDSTQNVTIQDWVLDKVTRPKNGGELDFTATYKSESIKNIKINDGAIIRIKIYPREDKSDLVLSIAYKAKETGWVTAWDPIKAIEYERVL